MLDGHVASLFFFSNEIAKQHSHGLHTVKRSTICIFFSKSLMLVPDEAIQ